VCVTNKEINAISKHIKGLFLVTAGAIVVVLVLPVLKERVLLVALSSRILLIEVIVVVQVLLSCILLLSVVLGPSLLVAFGFCFE
jgi:hypothetical protein